MPDRVKLKTMFDAIFILFLKITIILFANAPPLPSPTMAFNTVLIAVFFSCFVFVSALFSF